MRRLLLLLVLFPLSIQAADHAVTPAGSGSHSGADWSNACTGFTGSCAPGSLVRGDTYWMAGGNYTTSFAYPNWFNVANSGALTITIKGATASAHGPTAGWVNSLGVDVTQANWGY